jgi:RNA polymerase sigma factor (sigma-70 family)
VNRIPRKRTPAYKTSIPPLGAPVHDDPTLLMAWAGGDRGAGATLVQTHYDAVLRFFRNKAGEEADDLVQRTFLATVEAAHRYNRSGSFRAWLFGIARNVLFEHIRARTRSSRNDPDIQQSAIVDLSPGVSTIAARRADQRVLLRALQLIPLEHQMLLELYYWEELSMAELGQILEVPSGTVKSRLFRARALLREAIARVPSTPEESQSAGLLLEQWAHQVRGEALSGEEA